MNIMHEVKHGLKIEKANWQDICINKKRNGMNIRVGKKYETENFFLKHLRVLLNVFLTPVPRLSNHRLNKARLMDGKYLARYVEEH